MKTYSKCVLALAFAFCASLAMAAGPSRGVIVQVPFSFIAGSTKLPAGQYSVMQDETQNLVYLVNHATGASVALLPESNLTGSIQTHPSVNFVKVGGNYVMKVVHTAEGQGFSMRVR